MMKTLQESIFNSDDVVASGEDAMVEQICGKIIKKMTGPYSNLHPKAGDWVMTTHGDHFIGKVYKADNDFVWVTSFNRKQDTSLDIMSIYDIRVILPPADAKKIIKILDKIIR